MTIYAIPDPIINSKDPLEFLHCLHFDHVMDRPIKGEVLAICHRLNEVDFGFDVIFLILNRIKINT